MRLALVSDTHGRAVPAACAERMREADLVLHAGDVATAAALEELRALAPSLVVVAGNVDEPGLDLPETEIVEAAGVRIGLMHDAGRADGRAERMARRFPGCDVVVFGHSHVPLVERTDAVTIVNPGSATQRRRQPRHTMACATADDGVFTVRHVDLD